MKHKHADLIHAWADGAQIQYYRGVGNWEDADPPLWNGSGEYRIKPRRRPDLYKYVDVRAVTDGICQWSVCLPDEANLGLIFDGETKQLKSAEVLK